MLVQWCLKGVVASPSFDDADAVLVMSHDGLRSNWARKNAALSYALGTRDAHAALSDAALVNHVNSYASVAATTPYISLTAGVIERDPGRRVAIHHSAWTTARDFATKGGRHDGYVFECWVQLPGNPAPELPGFGEDVRNLNLHRRFTHWTEQGEITAKIVVPPRQIRRVLKFGASGKRLPMPGSINPQFVPPERISNIRRLV